MNRIVHRIGAFLAVLLMLWLAGTGSWMQLLDLRTVLTNAPPTDPTAVSMAEGMYGPNGFAMIQLSDFSAATFPADFDISKGVETVLRSARSSQSQGGEQRSDGNGNPTWVELRVVDGVPIGQIMKGGELAAFNALSGAAVAAVEPQPIPQGARLPASLRQKLKTLHRFWNRGDVPGVYFEFLAGLVLFTLIITGLILYFQLLKARAKTGRRQLFWLTGGVWRGLHRAVSVVAGAFLLCMAFSGTWIGFESSWSALHRGGAAPPAAAGQQDGMQAGMSAADGMGAGGQRNQNIPLREDEVPAMTVTVLQAMQRLHPDTPIKAIRLRTFGQMKQGVVITGGEKTDQLVFNAENGAPASLTEPTYPRSNFPFGVQTHENIKHFHSGEMFGVTGQFMNLFAGLSLLFLSISGLVVYFDLWSKRKKIGRKNFFWTR